jgi:hypothetical protein
MYGRLFACRTGENGFLGAMPYRVCKKFLQVCEFVIRKVPEQSGCSVGCKGNDHHVLGTGGVGVHRVHKMGQADVPVMSVLLQWVLRISRLRFAPLEMTVAER